MNRRHSRVELAALFRRFEPDRNGAHIVGWGPYYTDEPLDCEWQERGTIDGRPVAVYYHISEEESEQEDGLDIPFDSAHVYRIVFEDDM